MPSIAKPPLTVPKLTVVVSPREGHLVMEESLKSVLADDAIPFELIYIDICSPPAKSAAVRAICTERGAGFIRHDAWIAPALARREALARATTPYVICIDNDVFPEAGCFARLVACAEETGAEIVAPLYLEGPHDRQVIHTAGFAVQRDAAGRVIGEGLVHAHVPPADVPNLTRQLTDSPEYHCFLIRTELVRDPSVISDDVLLVHEHIDMALSAKERGFDCWLEPAARVNLAYLAPPRLGDLGFFLRRWDLAACEETLTAFCTRWRTPDPEAFCGPIREFLSEHLDDALPFHPGARREGLGQLMTAAELTQNRTGLREQAQARGYSVEEVRNIEAACDFATLICDGLYRADGRPFLNHLIGTASALIRYDVRHDVVLAALLHSAYTHKPDWLDAAEVSRVLASGGMVDDIVRALPAAKTQLKDGADVDRLTLMEVWALAIEAANDADMRLAGEYRATARPAEIGPQGEALLRVVLGKLGAPGLAESACSPFGQGVQGRMFGFDPPFVSFRLAAEQRRLAWTSPRPSAET